MKKFSPKIKFCLLDEYGRISILLRHAYSFLKMHIVPSALAMRAFARVPLLFINLLRVTYIAAMLWTARETLAQGTELSDIHFMARLHCL